MTLKLHTQKNWSLFILRWQDVPRVTKDGSQSSHSRFFNHPINSSSFLELPSFSKEVMLRSVRKAFWENWLGFLGLFQSIQDELACINEALNAVHKTGLSPTVQLWPRLVHALLPTKFVSASLVALGWIPPLLPPRRVWVQWTRSCSISSR